MNTFSSILSRWQQSLKALYPEREIANLFRFAVEDLFGITFTEQKTQKDAAQPQDICDRLAEVETRLQTGEPLQYIVGFTWFDDLKIAVSPAVLIPRPETEELVHLVARSLPEGYDGKIVDWCTGSGCIALALKQHFPDAQVFGYDLSEAAVEMARHNAAQLKLDVTFEVRDALSATGDDGPRDTGVIVSNPPYIPEKEHTEMRTNVKLFEPHMALFVPDDKALLFYEAIAQRAAASLSMRGYLFFEVHENYAEQTRNMLNGHDELVLANIIRDMQDKPRMIRAIRR